MENLYCPKISNPDPAGIQNKDWLAFETLTQVSLQHNWCKSIHFYCTFLKSPSLYQVMCYSEWMLSVITIIWCLLSGINNHVVDERIHQPHYCWIIHSHVAAQCHHLVDRSAVKSLNVVHEASLESGYRRRFIICSLMSSRVIFQVSTETIISGNWFLCIWNEAAGIRITKRGFFLSIWATDSLLHQSSSPLKKTGWSTPWLTSGFFSVLQSVILE